MGTLRGFQGLQGFVCASVFTSVSFFASGCVPSGLLESAGIELQQSEMNCVADECTPESEIDTSSTTNLAGTTAYRLRGATSAPFPYIEYLPGGYAADPAKAWPVIIMLHGLGEQGQGTTQADLTRAGVHGPNRRTREGRHFPAVILTPMTPVWWDDTATCQFVDFALANYRLDARRVYITGLSMGGGGTWGLAGKCAGKIAAIVPICGASGHNSTYSANMIANKVAVWAFHNQDDGTVGVGNSDGWIQGLGSRLGATGTVRGGNPTGNPTKTAHLRSDKAWEWLAPISPTNLGGYVYPYELHYTVYPTGGHDAWTKTYANEALWTWLFQQYRK